MRLLQVLPLTEDVLTAALGYEHLSFEDAQVAAAGDLADGDAVLTRDTGFLKGHEGVRHTDVPHAKLAGLPICTAGGCPEDAGAVRQRVGRDGAQGQGLAPGVRSGGDAVVDGGTEELLESVVGFEVEGGGCPRDGATILVSRARG